MLTSKDKVRFLVSRQIQLDHPQYTPEQLKKAVDETVDLIHQVQETERDES